jgi:hypothetical protein
MSDLSVRSRPAPAAHLAAAHRCTGPARQVLLTNSGRYAVHLSRMVLLWLDPSRNTRSRMDMDADIILFLLRANQIKGTR